MSANKPGASRRCDDGACHHNCGPAGCFRRKHVSPLSVTGCETWKEFDAMKTVVTTKSGAEIEAMIGRIEDDVRYSYAPADPFVNAPLALVQVELKGQVAALRWAAGLDDEMATSAKPAKLKVAMLRRKKRDVLS